MLCTNYRQCTSFGRICQLCVKHEDSLSSHWVLGRAFRKYTLAITNSSAAIAASWRDIWEPSLHTTMFVHIHHPNLPGIREDLKPKKLFSDSSKQNWSSDINLEVYDCSHTLACRLHMSLTHHHWRALTQVNHIMDDFCCLLAVLARTAIDIQIPGRFGSEISLESLSLRLLLMVLAAEYDCIPLIDKLDTMETCMGSMCRQARSRDPSFWRQWTAVRQCSDTRRMWCRWGCAVLLEIA